MKKSPNEVMAKFRTSKPAIGLAFRALLESGDVIVAHQRLAHCPGTNLCDTPRTNIYFRVTHIHFDRLVRSYVNGVEPWLGFNGLSSLIDGAFISFDNPSHSEAKRSDDDEHHDDNIKMENRKLLAARPLGLEKPVLTDTQIQDFVRMGYVTLPGFIGAELLEKATTQIRKVTRLGRVRYNSKRMYPGGEKGVAEIRRPVLLGPQFMDLMYKSGLVDAVEQLIGPMNVVVADGISDVFSIPRSSTKEQDDDAERKEFILDGPLRKGGWHVDTGRARFKGRGFDHLVRVGVCLSDGLGADENRGHVVVWPGKYPYFFVILVASYCGCKYYFIFMTDFLNLFDNDTT